MRPRLPVRFRPARRGSFASPEAAGGTGGAKEGARAALRLPALPPLYQPAGLARRWVAYALDLPLSFIFTFGWVAGVVLFLFLLDALLDLEILRLLHYGRNPAQTAGLFLGLFALPYTGYFVLPLHRVGKTAGFFFAHIRMIPDEGPPLPAGGRERTFGRPGLLQAFVAVLPDLLAGVAALSFLPDATVTPAFAGLLSTIRLPIASTLAFFILTQFIDRLLGRRGAMGIHERLARVRIAREPRLREWMERERRVTEAHIAGGMAHEIRNALGTARLQLDRLADPDVSARAQRSLEDILRSLTESAENGLDREGLKRAVAGVRRLYEERKLSRRALEEVSAAVDRGLRITRRVMDYSRLRPSGPAGGDPAGSAAPLDLNRLLSDLAESYRAALAGDGIDLRLALGATRPIRAHAAQCYSVFQNLLLNARDAIREKGKGPGSPAKGTGPPTEGVAPPTEAAGPPGALGGTIRISSGDGDRVWVRVEDDGVGIPAERLERIFDPFYSTKPSQGMGLGLNECRRIVDLYGGEIQAETEVGRGTRFTVLWPPGEPAAEDPGAPKVTP